VPVALDETTPEEAGLPATFQLNWLQLPGGRATPEFVHHVKRGYLDHRRGVDW